jgi:hypothetical protein
MGSFTCLKSEQNGQFCLILLKTGNKFRSGQQMQTASPTYTSNSLSERAGSIIANESACMGQIVFIRTHIAAQCQIFIFVCTGEGAWKAPEFLILKRGRYRVKKQHLQI